MCPFIFVMHSIFSYWEKTQKKGGFKNPWKANFYTRPVKAHYTDMDK